MQANRFERLFTQFLEFYGLNGRKVILENIDGVLWINDQYGDRKLLINPNIPTDMENVPVEAATVNADLYNYAITNGLYVEGSEFLYFSGATLYKCSVLFGIIHMMAFTATSPVTVAVSDDVYENPQLVEADHPVIVTITITKAVTLSTLIPYPAKIYSSYSSQTGMAVFDTIYVHLSEGVNTIEIEFEYTLAHFKNAPSINDAVEISYLGQIYYCYYTATNANYDEFKLYLGTGSEGYGFLVGDEIIPGTTLTCNEVTSIYIGQFTEGCSVRVFYDDDSYADGVCLVNGTGNSGGTMTINIAVEWNPAKTVIGMQKNEPA